nr:YbaN family protein [uncultured Treponema sp.]
MKYVWLSVGCIFLGLGVLGVFLPILPTTPFILVTLFCFAKGSDRMHRWLLSTKLYQNHVKRFNETRSMTLKAKVIILAFASAMLLSGFYFSKSIYARIIILIVLSVKYYVFIFKIKTVPSDTAEAAVHTDTAIVPEENRK